MRSVCTHSRPATLWIRKLTLGTVQKYGSHHHATEGIPPSLEPYLVLT